MFATLIYGTITLEEKQSLRGVSTDKKVYYHKILDLILNDIHIYIQLSNQRIQCTYQFLYTSIIKEKLRCLRVQLQADVSVVKY